MYCRASDQQIGRLIEVRETVIWYPQVLAVRSNHVKDAAVSIIFVLSGSWPEQLSHRIIRHGESTAYVPAAKERSSRSADDEVSDVKVRIKSDEGNPPT